MIHPALSPYAEYVLYVSLTLHHATIMHSRFSLLVPFKTLRLGVEDLQVERPLMPVIQLVVAARAGLLRVFGHVVLLESGRLSELLVVAELLALQIWD